MKRIVQLAFFFLCGSFVHDVEGQPLHKAGLKDSVVIPFEYKQSALYQQYTMKVIDSVIRILLKNDSVTLSIEGYAHQDEGSDTISKYLSLNRALFVKTYVLGRGVDSSRIANVSAFGKSRQIYRGNKNIGIGNCRAVIKLNYPPPGKLASDRDGDFIIDSLDNCPDEFGEKINGGCPDRNAIIVPFEAGQSYLHTLTYRVMDSIIHVLKNNPTWTIRLEGHAYITEGTPSVCERLAGERADMVKRYLLSKYIGIHRIDKVTNEGIERDITAGRNSGEIARNCRVEVFVNSHDPVTK